MTVTTAQMFDVLTPLLLALHHKGVLDIAEVPHYYEAGAGERGGRGVHGIPEGSDPRSSPSCRRGKKVGKKPADLSNSSEIDDFSITSTYKFFGTFTRRALMRRTASGVVIQGDGMSGLRLGLGELGPDQVPVVRAQGLASDGAVCELFNLHAKLWAWLSAVLPGSKLVKVDG